MLLSKTDPLERIATILEKMWSKYEDEEKLEVQEKINEKGIEYYKSKYQDLWNKHQELLRSIQN